MYKLSIFLITILFVSSCSSSKKEDKAVADTDKGIVVKNYEAQGFTVTNYKSYKTIVLHSSWDDKSPLGSFLLINKNTPLPDSLPETDYIIKTPVKSVAALSTTHIGMLHQLGLDSTITGVTDPFRIHNELINKRLEKDEIHQLGSSMAVDIEMLVNLAPDVVFKSGFAQVKQKDKQLLQSGLPVVYISEWQESTALARAEWIKVFAAFYECDSLADTLFNTIKSRYHEISKSAKQADEKPKIISGYNFKGTWYVPGGKSYMAKMIEDAGGDYIWKSDSTAGSIPLGFEAVLEQSQYADFWIGVEEETYQALLNNDERISVFKPFKEKKIYHRSKRKTEGGGNDYWENGIVRPDLVLSDLIKIFHPEILPEYQETYYGPLQ